MMACPTDGPKEMKDPLVVKCFNNDMALVFPAVQHLCTKATADSACMPNGMTIEWHDYEKPTSGSSCNKHANAAGSLRFLPVSVSSSGVVTPCPNITHGEVDFKRPTEFSATRRIATSTGTGDDDDHDHADHDHAEKSLSSTNSASVFFTTVTALMSSSLATLINT